jgi:hypothetical protein
MRGQDVEINGKEEKKCNTAFSKGSRYLLNPQILNPNVGVDLFNTFLE